MVWAVQQCNKLYPKSHEFSSCHGLRSFYIGWGENVSYWGENIIGWGKTIIGLGKNVIGWGRNITGLRQKFPLVGPISKTDLTHLLVTFDKNEHHHWIHNFSGYSGNNLSYQWTATLIK